MAADLVVGALKGIIDRSKIDPSLVEDICVGTVLAPGGGATEMRAASLAAGFTEATAVRTLNRQCSSGLQACVDVANQIRAGMIEVGIGAGVESMSTQYGYVSRHTRTHTPHTTLPFCNPHKSAGRMMCRGKEERKKTKVPRKS